MSAPRPPILVAVLGLGFALMGASAVTVGQDRGRLIKGKKNKTDAEQEPSRGMDLLNQPGQCQECHKAEGWGKIEDPGNFDHSTTGFPLEGQHKKAGCADCHGRGLSILTQSCVSCHLDPHGGQNTLSCETCHTARTWDVPRNFFDHERTRFPLTGHHASLRCEACHRPARGEPLAATPTECIVCHVRHYTQRSTPNHVAAGFTDCGFCHTTSSFKGATYTHRTYVQDGRHASLRCVECHTGNVFVGLAAPNGQDCIECHLDDFNSTANIPGVPSHVNGQPLFDTDCFRCHTAVVPPITFNGAQINPP